MKFGNCEYMNEFRRGSLFFRRLEIFRSHDEDLAKRNDIYEGITSIFSPNNCEITIDGHKIEKEDLIAPITFNISKDFPDYSLSLYAITDNIIKNFLKGNSSHIIDPRMNSFGTHCVVITDNQEFQKRIAETLAKLKLSNKTGLVEYQDVENFSGEWGSFKKPNKYSYQSEYRIMIDGQGKIEDFFKLEIGDISDISKIGTFEEIVSTFKVQQVETR